MVCYIIVLEISQLQLRKFNFGNYKYPNLKSLMRNYKNGNGNGHGTTVDIYTMSPVYMHKPVKLDSIGMCINVSTQGLAEPPLHKEEGSGTALLLKLFISPEILET